MYCVPMITTGELFQFFIFYGTHQTRTENCKQIIFHDVVSWKKWKKCSTILVVTTWYKRVHTCLRDVCTRYVQCLVTAAYIHAMYKYEKSWTCTYMYIQCCQSMYTYVHGMYNVYTKCCINMYVHRSDMYVHVYTFMYSFWILWTCTYNVQTCILSVV